MTRISNISQDMKCQYVYVAIDHYSHTNQINIKKRRREPTDEQTNERRIFMRILNYVFEYKKEEESELSTFFLIDKSRTKSNRTIVVCII